MFQLEQIQPPTVEKKKKNSTKFIANTRGPIEIEAV